MSQKSRRYIGEQDKREPAMRRYDDQKKSPISPAYTGVQSKALSPSDQFARLSHATQIRADVDNVGDNEQQAGAPDPARMALSDRARRGGDHSQPSTH